MDEDSRLVERVAAGDEDAVAEVVMRYQRQICAFLYRMTSDMEEAKDLTQKTFINVFKGIGDFRKKASLKTWIYRIALNTGINHLRSNRLEDAEVSESLACGGVCPLSFLIEDEKRKFVRKCLNALPDRQRLAIILRVYDGLSCAETAEVMACTEGAVKAHYHNGVKRFEGDYEGTGL